MGAHVLGRAPDGGRTVPGDRVIQQCTRYSSGVSPETRDRRGTCRRRRRNSWAARGSAQSRGVLDDGVEHRSGIGDVAAERREDLAAGRGLVASVAQLLPERGFDVRAVIVRIGQSPPIPDLLTVCALTLVRAMNSRRTGNYPLWQS